LDAILSLNKDLLNQPIEDKYVATLLWGARITKAEGAHSKPKVVLSAKPMRVVGDRPADEKYCSSLQQFGAFMSTSIMPFSTTPYTDIRTLSPQEFLA
jgi:hypothetical protein